MHMRTTIWIPIAFLLTSIRVGAYTLDIVSERTVDGETIRLQHIVRDPDALPQDWAGREIAPAPSPGETRTLTLRSVAEALNPYADMQKVVLHGPMEITVSARAYAPDFDTLDQAIEAYLDGTHDETVPRRFRVCRDTARMPTLPPGDQTITIASLDSHQDSAPQRVVRFTIDIDGQRHPATGSWNLPVIEQKPFWMATRPIPRGAVLDEADVAFQWLEASATSRYYPGETTVTGLETRRGLRAGQAIQAGALAEPMLARRGETINVSHSNGGLSITLRARALSDGRRDERIACINERSGRRMHVRLIGIREAVLEEPRES